MNIPELGHFALALACVLATAQAFCGIAGPYKNIQLLSRLAPALAVGQFMALGISFISLMYASVTDDFSVLNVAANSAHNKPLLYKITGVWGNHEGSILLWCFILSLCSGCISFFGKALPHALRARVVGILGFVSAGFLLFSLMTSNPFTRLWPAPLDGQGMNPLLQDPALAFHPPILYSGYVGFAVPFAFALAALLEGHVDAAWGRWVRPWALLAWVMLTGGIAIGSWWSYYVLGWGGYWFWDPVENASLLPWLTGTALVHSAIVVEKREALKIWTILLAIATFSLSLSGTFLVRSGILNSVHSFANDPARGVFILSLLFINCGGALAVFAYRAGKLGAAGFFAPISREGGLILNNVLLCSIAAIVLTGTMYPPFMALLFDQSLSVGKPFFDATTIPFTLPLFILMGIAPTLAWKKARLAPALKRLWPAVIVSLFAFGVMAFLWNMRSWLYISLCVAAIWMITASLIDLGLRIEHSPIRTFKRLRGLPRAMYGTTLAHIGAGVTALGVAGMAIAEHKIVDVDIGTTLSLHGYEWTLSNVHTQKGPNYNELIATLVVTKHGHIVSVMHPSRRVFFQQHQTTTNVAISTNLIADRYAVLGENHVNNGHTTYVLRLHYNPLAPWIWLGGLLMALGGICSLSDRSLRIGIPQRRKTQLNSSELGEEALQKDGAHG